MKTPEEQFAPGQRWISNTEAELGLGIVEHNDSRRVSLSFPAAGEKRIYAVDNAPLSRVIYELDEAVATADGLRFTIEGRDSEHGRIVYQGIGPDGCPVQIDEIDLDSFVQFSRPQDRLFAGQIDTNSSFELRAETLGHLHRHRQSAAFGLLGARVRLLPHQLYIASQVANRHAPRVLLADEVGLGKTIEAGLILHHQLLTGRASRALVVVPDSLIHQWLVEMLRRFNLSFTIIDADRCTALEASGETNPFETAQLVLCALAFLRDNPDRHQQALDADWDLLIVDEAHHLIWSEHHASIEYRCIESLATRIPSILLLTATPEQLGAAGHFARLRLLDPPRYPSLEQFREAETAFRPLGDLVQRLAVIGTGMPPDVDTLLAAVGSYLGDAPARTLGSALRTSDAAGAVEDVVQSLIDRHGTGRVLFRNTRDAVGGFPPRVLHQHALDPPRGFDDVRRGADIERLLHPEQLFGTDWVSVDPRVVWLSTWLVRHRNKKVLIICARADTARALEGHLRLRHGVRSAVFHEGMTLVARDRAAAYFADEEERAQALICSEIGSEGRNFQFANQLVLFDLPLHPDLLEQRIGRLDRIGQRNDVNIHVPYIAGSVQAALLRWYHEGANAFERSCPIGEALFQSFGEALSACLRDADGGNLDALIAATRAEAATLVRTLQEGRNRLLERSSCHPQRGGELVQEVVDAARSKELAGYMERLFDHYGIDQQIHGPHSIVVHPTEHMACDTFPGLPDDGLTATYQRAEALGREDLRFLTWEHPLVRGAMDMVVSGEFGNTAVATLKLAPLKPGTLLVETLFVLHCPVPRHLQVQRFLPRATLRLLVDTEQRDLSDIIGESQLNKLVTRVPADTAAQLVRHARTAISALVSNAEQLAATRRDALVEASQGEMARVQGKEIERLEALARVNPNIRELEIQQLRDDTALLAARLETAQLKLDSLRVVIPT